MIPFNGNSRLLEDTLNFIEASLEVTTQSSYQSSLTSYHRFCVRYGVARCQAFPATKDLLAAYICTGATLFRLTFKTLKVYFYGLKHWHSIYGLNTEGFEDNVCKKCLRAAHKLCIKPVKAPRLPLTLPLLEKVMRKMDTTYSDPWELRTEKALLAFGFQSGTRPSVYAVRKLHGVQVCDTLSWKHIKFLSDRVIINIVKSKTDPFREGRQVVIFDHGKSAVDAAKLLRELYLFYGFNGRAKGELPVFQKRVTGNPYTYTDLQRIVKQCVRKAEITTTLSISSYSLRRGFVTSAFLAGVPLEGIKALCGHKSEAYRRYVHVTAIDTHRYNQAIYKPRSEIYGWLNHKELIEMTVQNMHAFFSTRSAPPGRVWK